MRTIATVSSKRNVASYGESWGYYLIALAAVLPYVVVRRAIPRGWRSGFYESDQQHGSVLREAHAEVQAILGCIFRA